MQQQMMICQRSAASPSPGKTTIDCIPFDPLREVMLGVPTPVALVHTALVSKSWRQIIANQQFLADYRRRHPYSPFLGLYYPQDIGGVPLFQMVKSIRSSTNGDKNLARTGSKCFRLDGLDGDSLWCVLDCYNGHLLLTRDDETIELFNPLYRTGTSLCLPDGYNPRTFCACLLLGNGDDEAWFRVVSVQQHTESGIRKVRAIDYDSRTKGKFVALVGHK